MSHTDTTTTNEGAEPLLRSRIRYDPPSEPNDNMARILLDAFKRHSQRVLLVDTASKCEWTGAMLLDAVGRIATNLVRQVGLQINDVVMTICEHNDREIVLALAIVLAGASLYGTSPQDGYSEAYNLCELVTPAVIVAEADLVGRAQELRRNVAHNARIVLMESRKEGVNSTSQDVNNNNSNQSEPLIKQNGTTTTTIDLNNNCQTDAYAYENQFTFSQLLSGPLDLELLATISNKLIRAEEHILSYMLTSGSTGRPKVVPSTHEELVHGLCSMISACRNPVVEAKVAGGQQDAPDAKSLPPDAGPLMPLSPDEILSGDLPLDHGAGLNAMFLSLYLGAKYVVMPSYDVDTYWQAVSDHRISASISSATFGYKLFSRLKELIEANNGKQLNDRDSQIAGGSNKWDLSSFKYIACAGAKIAFIDLIREVTRVYPHIRVSQCYGATEIGFISMVHPSEHSSHLHSTGYLFPGLLAKVVPYHTSSNEQQNGTSDKVALNSNRCCGPNERGELLLWANSKFKGYRCHPADKQAAERIFANCHDAEGKFYRTGDQVHYDHAGRLYIHGRFKDTLVLMEDWKILPAELEEVVDEHPLVAMSAIVGMPDPNLPGCHTPKAFVKLIQVDDVESPRIKGDGSEEMRELVERLKANDRDFIAAHIGRFVAERTAKPKHLTGGVRILDEFPRVGLLNKVDRNALRLMP